MPTLYQLFDTFSANLGLYRKNRNGLFRCPLCLHPFSRGQIDSRELNRAHTLPEALRGAHWTLACKACNSKVGSEIESCETDRAQFGRALSGDTEETVRVEIWYDSIHGETVGPVHADMGATKCNGERRIQIFAKQQVSNPRAWEIFDGIRSERTLAEQWSERFEYCITRSTKRANLVYVHAAYLHMFHQFGYEWAFSPAAKTIREQIVSPNEPIIAPLAPALSGPLPDAGGLSLFLITEPADFRSFVVVLPQLDWPKRQGVWMPIFDRQYAQPPQRKGVEIKPVPVPDYHHSLHLPESKWQGYHFVQEQLGRKG